MDNQDNGSSVSSTVRSMDCRRELSKMYEAEPNATSNTEACIDKNATIAAAIAACGCSRSLFLGDDRSPAHRHGLRHASGSAVVAQVTVASLRCGLANVLLGLRELDALRHVAKSAHAERSSVSDAPESGLATSIARPRTEQYGGSQADGRIAP